MEKSLAPHLASIRLIHVCVTDLISLWNQGSVYDAFVAFAQKNDNLVFLETVSKEVKHTIQL